MIQHRYAIYLSYTVKSTGHSFSLTDFNSVCQSEIIHVAGQYQYFHLTSNPANDLVNQQYQSVSSSASLSLQSGSINPPVTQPTSYSINSISQSVNSISQFISQSVITVRQYKSTSHPANQLLNQQYQSVSQQYQSVHQPVCYYSQVV